MYEGVLEMIPFSLPVIWASLSPSPKSTITGVNAWVGHNQVGRLQVAMHDALRVGMR